MKKNSLFALLALLVAFTGCTNNKHFIQDANYRAAVESDYQEKANQVGKAALLPDFSDGNITLAEKEALQFLYAYMSLGDLADYSSEFYLNNVRQSFKTQEEMAWGKQVPEKLFRHFVLPVRVNNENLDLFRTQYYDELKARVQGLSMHDAILEINHWCHEHVTYTPSDGRTSSPIASMRTAYARCGEESTFTVTALRTVGIPARQVYTPRWAHTDNNHAWVEAWADGKWYYLGACEPSPVLDMGWFDEPVKRALLLHTKVFGKYDGPEDIMSQRDYFAEINVTENYAPTATATVKVVDENGQIVEDAEVEFGIYNYAEFHRVLTTKTDKEGKASIRTGKGDISAWVSKEGKYALQIVSANDEETTIVLSDQSGKEIKHEIDIVPPVQAQAKRDLETALIETNDLRLATEDSIRNAYIGTFMTEEDAKAFAASIHAEREKVVEYLLESRGNWAEIKAFLAGVGSEKMPLALRLLGVISKKDLRDAEAATLNDHLNHCANKEESLLFDHFVLNPRVEFEMLTPYRSFLQANISDSLKETAAADPANLVKWAERIKINESLNPQRIRISPEGVYKLEVADKLSKEIFFVALCRSLEIPARLEKVTGKLQYHHLAQWHDVNFETAQIETPAATGAIKLRYTPTPILDDPNYDTHFTIIKVDEGKMKRLNFRNTEGSKSAITWKHSFSKPVDVESGSYLLVSGTRMASGKVLGQITPFVVEAGKSTDVELIMRKDEQDIQVIGGLNPEELFLPVGKTAEESILATTGRGYFIIGILEAGREPTNHVVRDLARLKKDFEDWDRGVILLFKNESQWSRFRIGDFPELPKNITFGVDQEEKITKMIVENMKLSGSQNLPIFVIADTFGRIVFVSEGYQIGLGDRLIQTIKQL